MKNCGKKLMKSKKKKFDLIEFYLHKINEMRIDLKEIKFFISMQRKC